MVPTHLLKSIEKGLCISYIKNTFIEFQEACMDFVKVDMEYGQMLNSDIELKPEYETEKGLEQNIQAS